MGLPIFSIKFTTKAIEAIGLSARGFVAIAIKDATATALSTKTYSNLAEIPSGTYDDKNYSLIESVFKGSPTKVKVIVGADPSTFADIQALVMQNAFDIDYFVAPDYVADNTAIISFITSKRDSGAKIKGVLVSTGSDKEYIIDTKITNAKDENDTVLPNQEARVAGIVAGLSPTRSATYFVVNEVETVDEHLDPDSEIDNGLLIYINDGEKVKIARGVNSFVSLTPEKGALFSKIKNVETMDMISFSVRKVVQDDYVGKFTNSLDNKNLIVTAVNQFLGTLAKENYLNPSFNNECILDLAEHLAYAERNGVDTTGFSETQIKKIDTGDNLYLIINCRLLDTIEDVSINVYI